MQNKTARRSMILPAVIALASIFACKKPAEESINEHRTRSHAIQILKESVWCVSNGKVEFMLPENEISNGIVEKEPHKGVFVIETMAPITPNFTTVVLTVKFRDVSFANGERIRSKEGEVLLTILRQHVDFDGRILTNLIRLDDLSGSYLPEFTNTGNCTGGFSDGIMTL